MRKRGASKSPLNENPLLHPGQWLDEEINRVIDNDILVYSVYIVLSLAFAALLWVQYLFPSESSPVGFTLLAAIACAYSIRKIISARKVLAQLRLARDGEKTVGQSLEELRAHGYGVLHDVPGDKFNLDHVIFTPHGIFVVETKTFSKSDKNAKVTFDGKELLVAGRQPTRDPIVQVKAAAHWLQDLLKQSTGKSFPVRGVVVFPGWFVESKSNKSDVWVLNPKALQSFISNEPKVLAETDVHLAVFHVSRFVKAKV
jgi:hypothetical protein